MGNLKVDKRRQPSVFTIHPDIAEEFRAIAARDHISMSRVVEDLIKKEIERRKQVASGD
jgi:hypothetical protein